VIDKIYRLFFSSSSRLVEVRSMKEIAEKEAGSKEPKI
jgi:hypothetical protein